MNKYHTSAFVFSNSKRIVNNFDDSINVIKKVPQVQKKVFLDKYNILPLNYQSKIEHDTLIQKVILKKLINLMGATIADIDIELKMKVSRIKYLEKE